MNNLRLPLGRRLETEFAEYLAHGGVLRQHFRNQFRQPGFASNSRQMPHQMRPDALPLIAVDDDESHFGPAGFNNDVTSAADDGRKAILFGQHNQGDMIAEVDLHKEFDLLLRKAALHHKETPL